ncbi:hypothetical protein FVER53590_13968 [Fusarium verticillioides]|nr:hypothetical protein FVER53590_13968 [Fusarium verticillioides]
MASQEEAERAIRELTGEYRSEENVYESGRRFLREALLYIDARNFTNAAKRSEDPYVSFKIHPSHIEVEFNDNGFTKRDLEHICLPSTTDDESTSEDSLSSVFKSTAKIYLQSGNFSLNLRLSSSEGRVKPLWVSPSAPIPDGLTRMVVYFHDYGTQEHIERLKSIILAQFESLLAESLLFLRRLRRIAVEFYGKGGELRQSKRFRKHWMRNNRELLKAKIHNHDETEKKSQVFYVTERGAWGRRNIKLAFPLTEEGKPLIDARESGIFNVLRISESKCNFLMDADFEFDDEHKLKPNSRRNQEIYILIAATFLQSISKFDTNATLRYEWPLFLPPIAHKTPLSLEIRLVAQRNLLVKVYKQSVLRCMNEITVLPDHLKDENGQPLLDPFANDNLLSTDYPPRVVEIFKEHGAKNMQDETFWGYLENNMRLKNPRMHGKYTTEDWHARMARFLLQFSEASSLNASKVRSLAIVPLKDGTWTSILSGPVYFPRTGDISIPDSEDLSVVSPSATRDPDRSLFDESGVVYFNGEEIEWTSSSSCLWDAPPEMVTMRSLKSCYDIQVSNVKMRSALQSLFVETLGIQNAKLEHLVAELNELRIKNREDPAKILRIYDFLNTNIPSSQDMRIVFESSSLIFIPHGPYTGWHTSTEVLWSNNTDLCGMGTLDETYGSLRDFFVDKLGIESLSLRILYDRLIKSPKCEPQQMKEAIFILNDFLWSESAFLDPQPIRDAEIFPIKSPDGQFL